MQTTPSGYLESRALPSRIFKLVLTLAAACLLAGANSPADTVTEWNEQLERAIKTNAVSAALQARLCAIVHAAVYDAVNGIALKYEPYFSHDLAPAGSRPEAAAAQAAYTTLKWLFPNQTATFDAALAASLAQIPNAQFSTNSIAKGRAWGQSVADRIIAWRALDGLTNAAPGYFGGTNIGQWRSVGTPTAPDGSLAAIVPQMPTLVPFTLRSPSQFRPGPPYGVPLAEALASPAYAKDLNEVKEIGRVDSVTRTADQTAIARLWQASSTAEMNNCLRQVLPTENSLVDNARLFALANFVAADGLIAGFDAKYTYNFWRPHHAIRFADLDDNPATEVDPAWSALILAPRHQEYFSNHAVHSGGMLHALKRLLGDDHTFTLSSVDFPGFTWTFHSLSEAGVQVKEARIWGGIHYRNSCDVGEVVGKQIADYVLDNFLRVPALPTITQQPQGLTLPGGATASFTVVATGLEPLTYQWRSYSAPVLGSATNIPGATNATLVLSDVEYTARYLAVQVTDGLRRTVLSEKVRLNVEMAPKIAVEPTDLSIPAGERVTLAAWVVATPPVSYQWSESGALLSDQRNVSGTSRSNLVFTSVQSSNAGRYSLVITNIYGAVTSRVAQLKVVPPTRFSRVTTGPVVETLGGNSGSIWADFNNDGWLDLYVANYPTGTNHYYRNNGGGTFSMMPFADYLVTDIGSVGVTAVDYDNDGYLDLAVSAGAVEAIPQRNSLFHNNGDGTFSRVSAGGLGGMTGHLFKTDWADYDNDGFLDALVSDLGPGNNIGGTNQLWHNSGDGTFTRITTGPVVTDAGFAWGVLWFDYDNDQRMDLLTLNLPNSGSYSNYLYRNLGEGSFARITTSPMATDVLSGACEGAAWGDYDNDGLMDLFVTDSGGGRNRLYHNNGGGSFSNVNTGPLLFPPTGSQPHIPVWGDYDNDGHLDLAVSHSDRNLLYRNNGDGTFSEVARSGFTSEFLTGVEFFNNLAWVDYDNDGFLDLHFTVGSSDTTLVPNRLYHNEGNSNAWLEVKCVGTVANRSAIGTRLRLKATILGQSFWQMREVNQSGGWDQSSPLVAHFGLGDATIVETLRIEWPSGTVQELHNISPKQILSVVEPPRLSVSRANDRPRFSLKGGRNMSYGIEASTDLATWSTLTSVTITAVDGTVEITGPTPAPEHQFYRAVMR